VAAVRHVRRSRGGGQYTQVSATPNVQGMTCRRLSKRKFRNSAEALSGPSLGFVLMYVVDQESFTRAAWTSRLPASFDLHIGTSLACTQQYSRAGSDYMYILRRHRHNQCSPAELSTDFPSRRRCLSSCLAQV